MDKSWQDSVVLIMSSDPSEQSFGTGFVIHKDKQATYLLTCTHVVREVGGPGKIQINDTQAKVVAFSPEEGADLAILCIERLLDVPPLPLCVASEKGKPFSTAGFQPAGKQIVIRELQGTLGKQVGVQMRGQAGRIKAWDLEITDKDPLQSGYSGSPVVDEHSHVIGVVNTQRGEGKIGAAIFIEALEKIWPEMPPGLFVQSTVGIIEKTASVSGFASRQQIRQHGDVQALPIQARCQIDWGDAPHVRQFYGRDKELAELKQWIVHDCCQVVVVLGLGGIGKSCLGAKLIEQIQDKFEYVFWRSLQNAPPLRNILGKCILFLSDQQRIDLPEGEDDQTSLLLEYLKRHRCLLVLDNVETVIQYGDTGGHYREGYEGYSKLLQRIGNGRHQSCLLLPSREKPKEVTHFEGKTSPVRSLQLPGLGPLEGRQILRDKGLFGSDEAWATLIQLYSGNPLALKLVSEPVQGIFGGDVSKFLEEKEIGMGVQDLLDQQFQRLSALEQEIMYWLAIEREAISLEGLREDIVSPVSKGDILEALASLRRRSMVESSDIARFTLQPVIMEYVTNMFVKRVYNEISTETIELFGNYVLIKAQAKDYVRESQVHLILKPILERLLTTLKRERIEKKFKNILSLLREIYPQAFSYAAGNVLNLLLQLGCKFHDYDFSNLTVRQAYLQGMSLQHANFAHANLTTSVFTNTFGSVFSVALSPDGELLAAGTANGEIRIWHVSSGTLLLLCQGHTTWVRSVVFSPDGKILASGSEDQTIRLWDISTGECLKTLQEHRCKIRSVVFSPDGNLLASGGQDQTIRLWDISTGQCVRTLQEHSRWIWSIAFSPDGKILASGSEDQTIRLWDISTGECFKTLQGHSNWVRSVVFSPDGNLLASGSQDQTVRLWDISMGECFKTLQERPHKPWSVAFSPDGKTLASGCEDQTIHLWDISTGECFKTLQGYSNPIWSVAFSPNGNLLASGSENQTIRLWNVRTGESLKILYERSYRLCALTFSPDGSLLASGGQDQTIRLWNIIAGQCVRTLQGHSHWIWSVAFSPCGKILASGGDDQTIRLWDVSTGHCFMTLQEHPHLRSVAFSPDGKILASGGGDRMVRLWDVSMGECFKTLQGHSSWVRSVVFSPDGKILASSGDDQTIRLWDISTGECFKTLQGHSNWVRSVVFSPDGKILASGSQDQTVRLWDISTGECLKTLQGQSNWIWSIAFSLDGSNFASGSEDGTIKLWNIQTEVCLHILRSDRPYERMNITDVSGLTEAQKASLKALGAIEDEEQAHE